MEDLRIVRGNDFTLVVPVRRFIFLPKSSDVDRSIPQSMTVGNEAIAKTEIERVSRALPLSDCSILCVNLVGDALERPIRLPFTICENGEVINNVNHIIGTDPNDTSVLKVKVTSMCLECGWYGLEVLGTYDGRNFRSFERKVFRIVDKDGKSNVGEGEWRNSEPSYQVETMFTLYAQESYPFFAIDTETMKLYQYGVVENGTMSIDDEGHLIMSVDSRFDSTFEPRGYKLPEVVTNQQGDDNNNILPGLE